MIWFLASAVLILAVWYFYIKPLCYWKNKGVRQSKPWLFLGDSWRLLYYKNDSTTKYLKWMYDLTKGGRYFGFYDFSNPSLCVTDPELIKQIIIKDFDHFQDHDRTSVNPKIDYLWGNSVISLKGEKWKNMRTALSPSFTSSKMRIMFDLIREVANNVVSYILISNEDVIEVEMKDILSRFTNDVIATTTFGISVDSLREKQNEFFIKGRKMLDLQGFFRIIEIFFVNNAPAFICQLFSFKVVQNDVGKFFSGAIKEAIKFREENGIVRPDMIHLLMETRKNKKNKDGILINDAPANPDNGMSDDEIAAQALIFFSAGFETVSQALSFGAYELATHKDIQDKLRQEINDTFKKHGKPSIEVLQDMKYMDMVTSEILRKWPPILQTDRKVTKSYILQPADKTETPVLLEKGIAVWIPIYAIQNAPEFFPEPERFDPERFSPENRHKINPHTYLPFGAGPRVCIGARLALAEIKCLLFDLILNFEIVPTKKTKIPADIISGNLVNSFRDGNWLGLKRIQIN